MKNTKRFLALILALILATSGILSGIPGGGVARAEEWDVGSEIVGDETVADLAGEPWVEDSPSSAVVDEEEADDDPSAVVEEESVDGETEKSSDMIDEEADDVEQENLTETGYGLTGSSDIQSEESSVINENNAISVLQQANKNSEGTNFSTIEEEADEDSWVHDDVFSSGETTINEEDDADNTQNNVSATRNETLAGDPTTTKIYFTTQGINYSANGWSKGMKKIYVYREGGSGTSEWVAINTSGPDAEDTSCQIFEIEMSGYTSVIIASRSGGQDVYEADKLPGGSSNGQTAPSSIEYGYAYQLKNFSENTDGNNWNGRHQHIQRRGNAQYSGSSGGGGGGTQPQNTKRIYFDATLSQYEKHTSGYGYDWEGGNQVLKRIEPTVAAYTMPYQNGDIYVYYWGTGVTSPTTFPAMTRVTDTTTPSLQSLRGSDASSSDRATSLWYYDVPEGVDHVIFANSSSWDGSTGADGDKSGRTADIELPSDSSYNCFYADGGDDWVFRSGSRRRGGYWDKVSVGRDPEKRADVGTSYGTTVDTPSGTNVVDVPNGTAPTAINNETILLKSTLYDYYSDYELNGNNRDTFDDTVQVNSYRVWYQFLGLDKALSEAYRKGDGTTGEGIALYTGQFQPNWGSNCYAFADRVFNNSSTGYSGLNLYGWRDHPMTSATDNDQAWFMSLNNSRLAYGGEGTNHKGTNDGDDQHMGMVSKGLVHNSLVKTENNETVYEGLKTSNNRLLLPYFNDDFVNGANALSTKVGKVYNDVEFPFQMENRTSSAASNAGTVTFYKFATDYSMLGSETSTKVGTNNTALRESTTHTSDYGDVAILQKAISDGKVDYFLNILGWGKTKDYEDDDHNKILEPYRNGGVDGSLKSTLGFFPFNGSSSNGKVGRYNYGYGMKLEFEFDMRNDGNILDSNGNPVPVEFKFSGDDDVWVFIDDKLALDVGGDHTAVAGTLNFADRTQNSGDTPFAKANVDNVKKVPSNLDPSATTGFTYNGIDYATDGDDATTASSYTRHKLTMYYMERGMWDSNLMVEFNLPAIDATNPSVLLNVKKEWTGNLHTSDYASKTVRFVVKRFDPTNNNDTGALVEYAGKGTVEEPFVLNDANNWSYSINDPTTIKAFVDPNAATPTLYNYVVYELDDSNNLHEVGTIGQTVSSRSTEATVTIGEDAFQMTGNAVRTILPNLNTGSGGQYDYTINNFKISTGSLEVKKEWRYWNGSAYDTLESSAWKPVRVKLQRRKRASTDDWSDLAEQDALNPIYTVTLDSSVSWTHTFSNLSLYNTSVSPYEFYEYRAVELGENNVVLEDGTISYKYENSAYSSVDEFKVRYNRQLKPTPDIPATPAAAPDVTSATGLTANFSTLSAGVYRINKDIHMTAAINLNTAGTWTIDLNGHLLTMDSGATFTLSNGAVLNILDSTTVKGGEIKNYSNFAVVDGNGTVNLYSGIINGSNMGNTLPANGGAIWLKAASSGSTNPVFNMYGGRIQNTKASDYGGAVYVAAKSGTSTPTFNMYGGSILDCYAGKTGGAVYIGGTNSSTMGVAHLDGSSNLITFRGNYVTTGEGGKYAGAIFDAGDLYMKGFLDVGDGIYSTTAAKKGMDSIYVKNSTYTAGDQYVWIKVNGALTVTGDGYIDLESDSPSAASITGHSVIKNESPGSVDAETFCAYGAFFINSAMGLGTSGGYDYDAAGNLPLVTEDVSSNALSTENQYPHDWPKTVSDNTTAATYYNAVGDDLPLTAFTAESQRAYQSETYLVYVKGITRSDPRNWYTTIINQDEPVAAFVRHEYHDASGALISYASTNQSYYVAVSTQMKHHAADARSNTALDYFSTWTTDWTNDSGVAPTLGTYNATLNDPHDNNYYGWRSDLFRFLPSHDSSGGKLAYAFNTSTVPAGFETKSVTTQWHAFGGGDITDDAINSSSYTNGSYETVIVHAPNPMSVTVTKSMFGINGTTALSGLTPTVKLALARATTANGTYTIVPTSTSNSTGGVVSKTYDGSTGEITHTWTNLERALNGTYYYYKIFELPSTSTKAAGDTLSDGDYIAESGKIKLDDYYYTVNYTTQQLPATASGDLSLALKNTLNPPRLRLSKYAKSNTGTPVEATFTLYASNKSTSKGTYTTTSGTGEIDFSASGLGAGTYYLKETSVTTAGYDAQGGYLQIILDNNGSLTWAVESDSAKWGFVVDTASPGSLSDNTPNKYTYKIVGIPDPKQVSVTVTKAFSPALTESETTTVFLRLMRQKKSGNDYVDDSDFSISDQTKTLNINGNNVESFSATWTGLPRYDANGVFYKYYVIEVDPANTTAPQSLVTLSVTNGGSTTSRAYTVTQSAVGVPTGETDDIDDLEVTNTIANFNLKVNKVFRKNSDTSGQYTVITNDMTQTVYIKLMRKSNGTDDPTYNALTNTSNIKSLTSSTNPKYEATWSDLARYDSSGYPFTYYAVEVVPNNYSTPTSYSLRTGTTIELGGQIFTVSDGEANSYYTVTNATTTDGASVTVTNTLVPPRIDIEKVDSSNHNTKLSGAVFSLKRVKDASASTLGTPDNVQSATSVTSTGIAAFADALPDGTYELVETTAPAGYAVHSGKITFTVTNGVISVGDHNASGLTGDDPFYARSVVDNVFHFKLTIENTAGTELPSTGEAFGLSRMGFASLGTVLLTAFVALYMYKKRRRYYDLEGGSDDNI